VINPQAQILCAACVWTTSQRRGGCGRNVTPRFGLLHFAGVLIMDIADHTAIRSHLASHSYGGWIGLGCVAFVIVAIAALYFASGGPGVAEAELAIATALP
jgi:hypothetical protein